MWTDLGYANSGSLGVQARTDIDRRNLAERAYVFRCGRRIAQRCSHLVRQSKHIVGIDLHADIPNRDEDAVVFAVCRNRVCRVTRRADG